MAVEEVTGIVLGEDFEIHDGPHIRDSRITVRYVQCRVEERGLHHTTVADQHDLELADIYATLSYYHDNLEEPRAVEARHAARAEEAAERTMLNPPEQADVAPAVA